MVLRRKDIQPRISLETYVGHPSLQRIAIPITVNSKGKTIGLITKAFELDPLVAKGNIFLDLNILEQKHTEYDPTTKQYKSLFSKSELDKLSQTFKDPKEYVEDPLEKYGTKGKFLEKTDTNLKVWESMVKGNGGWLVKKPLLYRDLKGFRYENNIPISKSDMKDINPCKYYNTSGLKILTSTIGAFIRTLNLRDTDKEDIKIIYEELKKPRETPKEISRLSIKKTDPKKETERIELLKKLTSYPESIIKKDFTTESSVVSDTFRLRNAIISNFESTALFNRDKSCKIITILSNLQDRVGWHNRITPMDSVNTVKKAHYTIIGEEDPTIQGDLKRAEKNIRETSNLLKICDESEQEGSCINPTEKSNLGLYGRNKDNKYLQKAWTESDMRVYAYLEVPLVFYRRSSDPYAVAGLVRDYNKAISDANIENKDSMDDVYSFASLSRFGNVLRLPLIDPSKNAIPFVPNPDSKMNNISIDIVKKIKDFESGKEPTGTTLSNSLNDFRLIKGINKKDLKNQIITETMYYPHMLASYQMNENEKQIGCADVKIPYESDKKISIKRGNIILLDGNNELIRWKSGNKNKTIGEVQKDIMDKTGSLRASDPDNWKWSCIADRTIPNGFLSKLPSEENFTVEKFPARRKIDLYHRLESENNVTVAVDKDSVAYALKDIAIQSQNAITLGAITQMDNYVKKGNPYLLSEESFSSIKSGGSPDKRLQIKLLEDKIDSIQKQFGTEKQMTVIRDLVGNAKNTSTLTNPIIGDPQSKLLIQRRKNIRNERFGLPQSLFVDPNQKEEINRDKANNNAVLSLETNFMDVFRLLDQTPKIK